MRLRTMVTAVGAIVLVMVAGVATSGAGIKKDTVLRFLDVRGDVHYLDVGAPAQSDFDPSPGDTFFFGNTLKNAVGTRDVGRFVSTCVALFGSEFKCTGTLLLERGTIELAATVDFASDQPIRAAVIGGTRRFANVGGRATITPSGTEGTSSLVVELVAIR